MHMQEIDRSEREERRKGKERGRRRGRGRTGSRRWINTINQERTKGKEAKNSKYEERHPAGDIAKVHDHLTIHVITFVILVAAFKR